MSCKPMTKKEWAASVDEMWRSAVECAYKDLIDEAVKAERQRILAILRRDTSQPIHKVLDQIREG